VILRRRVEVQADQLRESEQRFRHLAQHDSLTGLPSRMVLEDRLKDAIENARRNQIGLAMLMVDLDKFKEVNDTFGHLGGDEVLRVTAERLLEAVRTTDTVVRLGGDEFVVLLPEIRDAQAAELVASTLVSSLSRPIHFAGEEVPVSASVGVETAFAGKIDTKTLMQHADAALYRAKNSGRNCFQVYAPGWEEIVEEKAREQDDTRAALPKA
jgi:diguanylate cyclase (GGDEF)-like protein